MDTLPSKSSEIRISTKIKEVVLNHASQIVVFIYIMLIEIIGGWSYLISKKLRTALQNAISFLLN